MSAPPRLSAAHWAALRARGLTAWGEQAPAREAVQPGVVHLGLGAFTRAHQIAAFDAAVGAGDARWGVVGVSLRHPAMRDALAPQDGLYTLLVRDGRSGTAGAPPALTVQARVIGALRRVLVAPEQPQAVLDALLHPAARLVTLTVTEKGYALDAANQLDLAHPDIAHDLARPQAPRSAVGYVAAALALRAERALPPLAVLSCDNLRANGQTLRAAVLRFAQQAWPQALPALEACAFPDSMVDRIVPATQAVDRADAQAATGLDDAMPVRAEPFSQWVLQRFAGEQPDWSALAALSPPGVQVEDEVAPFEQAKLRLLNAAHTALALIGALRGHSTIAAAASEPALAGFVRTLMEGELAWAVPGAPGLDPAAYMARLWPRFMNPALGHGTHQVASDTSIKLTQRHLPVVRERLAAGLPVTALGVVIAAWARYLQGRTLHGQTFTPNDPGAQALRAVLVPLDDADALVSALLAHTPVFGDLGRQPALREAVRAGLSHPLLARA